MSQTAGQVDTTVARAYEQHMVPGMFARWAEIIVAIANPQPGEHVLDVACGTGIGARIAARAAGASGKVSGIDIDPGVIEVARELGRSNPTPMEWHCSSALKLPFADGQFDLCLCLQGLQFFPDRLAGLAEIHRVLRPSGRLVASLWAPLEFNKGHHEVVRALERQGVDASAAKRACSFGDTAAIRDAFRQAGFADVELRTEDGVSHFASMDSFFNGMTMGSPSTRHAVALLPEQGREIFFSEVRAALTPYVRNGELQYPMRTHVVIARP